MTESERAPREVVIGRCYTVSELVALLSKENPNALVLTFRVNGDPQYRRVESLEQQTVKLRGVSVPAIVLG